MKSEVAAETNCSSSWLAVRKWYKKSRNAPRQRVPRRDTCLDPKNPVSSRPSRDETNLYSFAPIDVWCQKRSRPLENWINTMSTQSYGRRAGNSKDAQTKKNWNIKGWHISFASFWAPSDMSTHEKAYLYAHTRGSFAMNAFHNVTSSQRYMHVPRHYPMFRIQSSRFWKLVHKRLFLRTLLEHEVVRAILIV